MGGEGGRCVGLTTLPPSYVDCLEIWEPQPPGTLRACPGITLPFTIKCINKPYSALRPAECEQLKVRTVYRGRH